MPAVSRKQQQFMAICAHSPSKAKGKCPPHKVAQEFSHMAGEKVKLSAVKTRARHKGPQVRPGHPEDDRRYVRYY